MRKSLPSSDGWKLNEPNVIHRFEPRTFSARGKTSKRRTIATP
jgi:hypothetical protein